VIILEKFIKFAALLACVISVLCSFKKVMKAFVAVFKTVKAIKLYKTEISN
jgi:hypothetical protein